MTTERKAAPLKGGAAARSNGKLSKLPRLGSEGAPKAALRSEEVEIPDRGVSVLLEQPSVETMVDLQAENVDEENVREAFEFTVGLVAHMLVEPDWSDEQLRTEVQSWSMNDWGVLQNAALRLSGAGEEIQRAAQEEFPGKED